MLQQHAYLLVGPTLQRLKTFLGFPVSLNCGGLQALGLKGKRNINRHTYLNVGQWNAGIEAQQNYIT